MGIFLPRLGPAPAGSFFGVARQGLADANLRERPRPRAMRCRKADGRAGGVARVSLRSRPQARGGGMTDFTTIWSGARAASFAGLLAAMVAPGQAAAATLLER